MRTVAILFAYANGPYSFVDGVDVWDVKRDARKYDGPFPVVAHPPCGWWSKLAPVNSVRYGRPIGDDGGCFASALASVRRVGGVIEHPAGSYAWRHFNLSEPHAGGGWQRSIDGSWVCQVSQCAYGHTARKATWLYLFGAAPTAGNWDNPEPTAQCSNLKNHGATELPRLTSRQASETPPAFAAWLVELARASQTATADKA